MNEQLKVLLDLQKIDSELYFLQTMREKKPSELEHDKQRQQQAQAVVQRIDDTIKETRMEIDRKELDINQNEAEIEKAQIALNTARSNEEYQVFKSQIEKFQETNGSIEEYVLEQMSAIDGLNVDRERASTEVDRVTQDLNQKEKEIQSFLQEVDERVGGLGGNRSELLASADKDALEVYEKVLTRYNESALALVENSVCQGCYMSLTKQMLNELMVGRDLVQCRNCVRILYLHDA